MFARSIALLGEECFRKLQSAHILVVGIGGVGGAVVEVLARTGAQNITLVDGDVVSLSNLNRQIFATQSNIGHPKVLEMKNRILSINPNASVDTIFEFVSEQNIDKIVDPKFDYIIDCIDDINAKALLANSAKQKRIPIASALGAGNRMGLPSFEMMDIFETSYDPLAKVFRKKLRENNISSLDVCAPKAQVDKKLSPPASVMWQPMTCGAVLSAFVIDKIIKK